jgi:hypothetical protein
MRHPHPAILIAHLLGLDTSHRECGSSVDALHRLGLGSRLLELLVVRGSRSSVHLRRILGLMEVHLGRLLVMVDGAVVRDGGLLRRQSLVRWAGQG